MPPFNSPDNPVLAHLAEAEHVLVLTGAGVSAASGVPTFRDALTGYWADEDPMQLATPEAFARDPKKVAAWYEHRRVLVEKVKPNAGHVALAALERWQKARGRRWTLVTQNVDGLHARAGSQSVHRLHGTLLSWPCTVCAAVQDRRGLAMADFDDCPPACPACGGALRPGVVWFGEPLPMAALQAAEVAAQHCDVFLAIGTSGVVHPAAGLADVAKRHGAFCVQVNPDETAGEAFVHHVQEGSETCLPRWADALTGAAGKHARALPV